MLANKNTNIFQIIKVGLFGNKKNMCNTKTSPTIAAAIANVLANPATMAHPEVPAAKAAVPAPTLKITLKTNFYCNHKHIIIPCSHSCQ